MMSTVARRPPAGPGHSSRTQPAEKGEPEWSDSADAVISRKKWTAADFIVPAADSKGHSERQWFRCQPGHDRMMDMIVASKRFPFRTRGDLIRWSVWMGLHTLEKMEPNMPSVTRQVDLMLAIVREDEYRAEMEDVFGKITDRITVHLAEGREGNARQLISQIKGAVDQMPDGPWKERYWARFRKQFATYLKGDKKSGFMKTNGDGDGDGMNE